MFWSVQPSLYELMCFLHAILLCKNGPRLVYVYGFKLAEKLQHPTQNRLAFCPDPWPFAFICVKQQWDFVN